MQDSVRHSLESSRETERALPAGLPGRTEPGFAACCGARAPAVRS